MLKEFDDSCLATSQRKRSDEMVRQIVCEHLVGRNSANRKLEIAELNEAGTVDRIRLSAENGS